MFAASKSFYPTDGLVSDRDAASSAHDGGRAICLAFTVIARHGFTFDGMTHRGDRPGRTAGHAVFVRVGSHADNAMQVTLVLYDAPDRDQVCRQPLATLFATLPGLRRELGDVELHGPVTIVASEPDPDLADHAQWVAQVRQYLGRNAMNPSMRTHPPFPSLARHTPQE